MHIGYIFQIPRFIRGLPSADVFLLANIVHHIINSNSLITILGLFYMFGTTNKSLDKLNFHQYNSRHIL